MKKNVVFLYISLLFMVSALGCQGCQGCNDNYLSDLGFEYDVGPDAPSFKNPDLDPQVCTERCIEGKRKPDVAASCKIECEEKRGVQGLDIALCDQKCRQVVEQADAFLTLSCQSLCFQDDDRDGVPNAIDQCSNSKDDRVNWLGCLDSDLDGVPDKDDDCPRTKKDDVVNLKGCTFVGHCHEGNCSTTFPTCATKEECDRQMERPLLRQIPLDVRKEWVRREMGKRSAPVNCAGEKSAPGQPFLSLPPQGINPVDVGQVRVTLENGIVVKGPKYRMEFNWEPVEDACQPVSYAVLIESYHCHHVQGVVEALSYYNRGWCKWEPLTYVSNIQDTKFSYDFEIGKELFDIHKAFEMELRFSPPRDGPFKISYQPFWLRTRVLTIDGNGSPSASGMHSDHRYFVFYNAESTRPKDLVNIPVAP